MKNNKLLKTLATLTVGAVAAVGCLGFAACGDDHKHTWGNNYGKNADGHWQVCTDCKEQSTTIAHDYDGDADTTCNTCGWVRTISGTNPGTNPGGENPGTNPGGQATAHTNTFSFSGIPSSHAHQDVLTQADFTGANAFLTVAGSVKYRKTESCLEVKEGGLTVTFTGTGTLTISFASTGGSNVSGLAVYKGANGPYLEGTTSATKLAADDADGNKAGLYTVTGTSPVQVQYNITEAGTYTIFCLYTPSGAKARGSRIHSVSMVDNY